ncbi:hypothetical protein FRC06_011846 [Ceratobasidium sp. 370]|nr:hypothetical protein FRC06_011846 [Ceratobasidium sp. 370]
MSEFTFAMKSGDDFRLPTSARLLQRFWRDVSVTGCVASVAGRSGGHFQAGYWDVETGDRHFEYVKLDGIVTVEFGTNDGWRGGTEPAVFLKTPSFVYALQYASRDFEPIWATFLRMFARANNHSQSCEFAQHDVMSGKPPWWPVQSNWDVLYDQHKPKGGEDGGNGGGMAEGEGDADADADAEGEEEGMEQEQEQERQRGKDLRKRNRHESPQRGTKRLRQSTSASADPDATATTDLSQPKQPRTINKPSSSRSANVDTSANTPAGPSRTSVLASRSSQGGTTAAATTSRALRLRIPRPPDWNSRRSAVAATIHRNATPPQPQPLPPPRSPSSQPQPTPPPEPQHPPSTPVVDRADQSFDSGAVRWPFTQRYPESPLAASHASTHAELAQGNTCGRGNRSGSVDGSSAHAPTIDDSSMSISSGDLSCDEPPALFGCYPAMHEAPPGPPAELTAEQLAYLHAQSVLARALASLANPGVPMMDLDDPPSNVPASTSAIHVDHMLSGTPHSISPVDDANSTAVPPLTQPSAPFRPPSSVRTSHAVPDAVNSSSTATAAHVNAVELPTQPSGTTVRTEHRDRLPARLVGIDIDRRTKPRPPRPA